MIITCEHCRARYQYDEARFEGKPSKKIRCAKCQQVFEAVNAIQDVPTPAPAFHADETSTRKPMRTRPQDLSLPEIEDEEPAAVEGPSELPQLPVGKRFALAIISGPDAGTVHRIEKAQVVIGRSSADVALNDGEVSRSHAGIEIRDNFYYLDDLGSTNGTLFNGQKVTEHVELQNQSEFQVGGSILMFIVTDTD